MTSDNGFCNNNVNITKLKYYIKQKILEVYTKKNILIFLMIIVVQILIQLFLLLNIFAVKKTNINTGILAFTTDFNTPYRLYANNPRIVVFDKDSQFSNFGLKYYTDIKNSRNLTNLQFYFGNVSQVDNVFKNDYDTKLNITANDFVRFNYYNCSAKNDSTGIIQNKVVYYSTIMDFEKYDRIDMSYPPIESYGDSLPFLFNEMLAYKLYNNSQVHFQVINYVKGLKIDSTLNILKILSSNMTYLGTILKKIFDLSLYKLSFIFIDILFTERNNNIFLILKIYNFSKLFHFIGNFIPFFIIISLNSLIIANLYYIFLVNTSLMYIFFMLITIQFCQYIYFYTLVAITKKKNFVKMKVLGYIVFLINLLLSVSNDFSYSYILFPPFFMRVLNNYFYDSMLYYSQIEENFILEMIIFILTWTLLLTISLTSYDHIKNLFKKKDILDYVDQNESSYENRSNSWNFRVNYKNKKFDSGKIYQEKTKIKIYENKINFITGDNSSGKTNILKQITNKLPKNKILYLFSKKKGIIYNLTLKENFEFLKRLIWGKCVRNKENNENLKLDLNTDSNLSKTIFILDLPIDHENKNTEMQSLFSKLISNFENDLDHKNIINQNTKDIHLYKLYLLLLLIKEYESISENSEEKILILDQPFNKLDPLMSTEILNFLNFFSGTIIISTNYKPNCQILDKHEMILETKNINYKDTYQGLILRSRNNSINSGKGYTLYNYKDKDISNHPDHNKNLCNNLQEDKKNNSNLDKISFKKIFLFIFILLTIFFLSYCSFYFFSVNIDDPKMDEDSEKIFSKNINEPMTNIYISDSMNRNSTFFNCLSQKVNFLNATENRAYLDHYFNKSVIFKEHAIEISVGEYVIGNITYVNLFIISRPIDIFRNIQLSAYMSDCLIYDPSFKFKIETNFEIRHFDSDRHINKTIRVDLQLFLITLPYFLILILIIDFKKNYLTYTLLFSSLIIILVVIEYYLTGIPIYKWSFIPKLLLYSLCCNLMNFNIKKFLIGIFVLNSSCFLMYPYYGLVYYLNYFFKIEINSGGNYILYWIMIILESFSPYNRILFYKPVAFTYMMVFSLKEKFAYDIYNGYIKFYTETSNITSVAICHCLLGTVFWLGFYVYRLKKKYIEINKPLKDFEIKRSNEFFLFEKEKKVKDIVNTNSRAFKSLCLENVENKSYSELTYTVKNKVLLTYIGWKYLSHKRNTDMSNDIKILNKEKVEIHFDLHTLELIRNGII